MSDTKDILDDDQIPTAPPQQGENGFFVISEEKSHEHKDDQLVREVADAVNSGKEDISKILDELNESKLTSMSNVEKKASVYNAVTAEADSSTSINKSASYADALTLGPDECATCPYYKNVCSKLNKLKECVPPEVVSFILWKNPKVTGIFLVSVLVLLISLASVSLMSVVSTYAMLALSISGSYLLYVAVLFRIKGTHDETFEKLNDYDIKIRKDILREISLAIERDLNKLLLQAKSIILWENMWHSLLTFGIFYCIHYIGSIFNTITLCILILVTVFTLPKIYQVYKTPIDQASNKTTAILRKIFRNVQDKLPFLTKSKQQ